MLRNCVSLGNLGGPTSFSDPVADLTEPSTADRWTNLTFIQDTGTQWVRLFVEWPFWSPNAPLDLQKPANTKTTPWGAPVQCSSNVLTDPVCARNPASMANLDQVAAQVHDMNTNINAAHAAGVKVILTSDHFPKWLSDPTSNTELSITTPNAVFPADSVLMVPTKKPLTSSGFQRTDFQYYQWVVFLMLMYHPGNPSRLALAEGASIDAFELVNEPNLVLRVPSGQRNSTLAAHKTALMMTTARSVVDHYNRLWGKQGTLTLLGPATAGSGNWQSFTRQLISNLTNGGKKAVRDPNFGWSHHNYHDVENIGNGIASLDQQLNAFGPAFNPPLFNRDAAYRSLARYLYGSGTQQLRGILDPPSPGFPDLPGLPHTELWYGAGSSGDPDPKIWLTEGGCRLDQMPHFNDPPPIGARGDPNAHYDTNGNVTSIPAVYQRQLQLYAVGGAAQALQHGSDGRGVEMFTNFLVFDQPMGVGNKSGLCDTYDPNPPPTEEQNETAAQYTRPAYGAWKAWSL